MASRSINYGRSFLGQLARGMEVDPSNYYFRIARRFETAASQYGWMNNILAVGIGDRKRSQAPGTAEHMARVAHLSAR
jgi:hypothetical protein